MALESAAAIAAIIGTGYGIASGERGAQQQSNARKMQRQAQGNAENAAAGQARREGEETRAANRNAPDPTALLAEQLARPGRQTSLSGGGAADKLRLGRSTLLGE